MKELEHALGTEAYRLLLSVEIESLSSFLAICQTDTDSRQLAHQIGLPSRRIKKWLQRADIYRVRGIGREYVSLFEAAKIASVRDIANLSPQQLQERLKRANRQRKLVRRIPSLRLLNESVQHASMLLAAG